ncbi:hypothetical protein PGC34_07110 [Pseudomonas kribbensis]|uniref:hypothetical protein n=1 Tax=Pseudomonas kribbensis TaxID=1628086 RepID=UPI00273862FF|nr:hypothetical protein [Pseudomonas sp. A29(2023)]MDL5595675.1 hypothetical protein [Bacillus subtilis]
MSERFWLRRQSIGPQKPLEISKERYEEITAARLTLIDAKNFEERYEMVIGNFLELERFIADFSLRTHIEADFSYRKASTVFLESNRLVMNLLTTFKSYVDQTPQDFKHLPTAFGEKFQEIASSIYDKSFAYRFASALRNHTQHYSPPVHAVRTGGTRVDWIDKGLFFCKKQELAENPKFKKAVLDEFNDEVDLKAIFRELMEHLSRMHIKLRQFLHESVQIARSGIEEAMQDFVEAQGKSCTAIGLAALKEFDGEFSSISPVLLDWDETRIELIDKNRNVLNLISTSPSAD